MAEIVPFFATELEHKTVDTLPTDTVPLADVLNAVPKFNEVAKNNLLVHWRLADGTLTYHIFKADRKNVFDQAQHALSNLKDTYTADEIARKANSTLEKIPWWSGFETALMESLTEYFKMSAGKVGYYSEVDSWSVSLEAGPLWTEAFIKGFVSCLGSKLGE